MIIGIGSDIVKVSRIEALLVSYKQRFLHRVFTMAELELFKNIDHQKRLVGYVAKRFAAKEAFSKAFGTGIGGDISFHDVEIFSEISRKPYFKLSNKLSDILKKNYGKAQVHLSMTDEEEYAQAFVIIERVLS